MALSPSHQDQEQPLRHEVVQFLRGYWAMTQDQHRRVFQAAALITVMQVIAIIEPGMITSMVQDALRLGAQAKRIIAIKVVIALLILVLQSLVQWRKAKVVRDIAVDIENQLMMRFLDRLLRLGGVFHETHNVGQLQGTIARGVAKVTEITFLLAHELLPLVVMLVATAIAVTWYSWASTLVIVIAFTIFVILTFVTRAVKMRDRQERQELRRSVDKLFGTIIACVRTVWIFGQESYELGRMAALQRRIKSMLDQEYDLYDHVDFWRGIVIGFGRLGVVAVCLAQAFRDPTTIANLFLVLMLAERLFRMSYNIGGIFDRCVEAMKPVDDMMKVLATPITITDPEHPVFLGQVQAGIVYRQASYRYPSRPERVVLNGVDLEIKAGKTIGIVGGSGGGKSTLVKALLRFIDLDAGQLLVDGVDVRNLTLAVLRRLIRCVSQDVEIFDGTVAMNIAYGKPEATQAEIERAARLANIHEQIMGFAQGYETLVGNEGQQLSGGQRQRIAIARALLSDPAVIVFDEATSAVDPESDVAIHEAVERLARMGKTIVIIAHRLGTVRGADRIYCLDQGSVVEAGTHDELVARRGRYHALWTAHERGSRGRQAITATN